MYIASLIIYAVCLVLSCLAVVFLGWCWVLPLLVALTPLIVFLSILVILALAMFLAKPEKEEKASCANCLFKDGAQYDPEKQCLGEHILKESHIPGVVCPYYRRKL